VQAKSIFLVATVVFIVIVFSVSQFYPQAPKDWNGQPVETEDERCWDSSIESRVDMVSKSGEYQRKDNIFDKLPTNKNDNKCQSILFKKSFELLFGEVV
jgi:hypothetical protein